MRKSLIGCSTNASDSVPGEAPYAWHRVGRARELGLVFDRDVGEHVRLEVVDMDAIKFVSKRAEEKHDILITKGDISRNVHKGET